MLLIPQDAYVPLFAVVLFKCIAHLLSAGMPAVEEKEYRIEFMQIYLSKPTMTESDGETYILFPKEARLRNLT
jgi:hypothetical protein